MRLSDELKAIGSTLEPMAFEGAIIESFQARHPGLTVDAFLCAPWLHAAYLDGVRRKLGVPESCEEMILRRLMNARKRGLVATGERPVRVALAAELIELGSLASAADFRSACVDVFTDVYLAFTVDRLLMQWRDALHYCDLVCWECELPRNRDAYGLVLRTLLNTRRQGNLSLRSRGETDA